MSIDQLPQISPASWGARIDYDSWPRRPIRQAFVHWLGSAAPAQAARGDLDAEAALLRSVERFHVNVKGWRGIAYDWAIGNSGVLYRLRGHGVSGGTSGDVDRDGLSNNVEGDAVCVLIGEGQEPSSLALHTLARVVWALAPAEGVWPHCDARGIATDCPGPTLTRWARAYHDQEEDMPLTDEDVDRVAAAVERRMLVHLSFRDRVHWDPARQVLGQIARKVGVPRSFLRRFDAALDVARNEVLAALDGKEIVDPAANRGTVNRA